MSLEEWPPGPVRVSYGNIELIYEFPNVSSLKVSTSTSVLFVIDCNALFSRRNHRRNF